MATGMRNQDCHFPFWQDLFVSLDPAWGGKSLDWPMAIDLVVMVQWRLWDRAWLADSMCPGSLRFCLMKQENKCCSLLYEV